MARSIRRRANLVGALVSFAILAASPAPARDSAAAIEPLVKDKFVMRHGQPSA
jgi:hypothetical protein